MTVITLSRELGSRGDYVAVGVAERLGLRLVGREIINRAAADAGAGEVALAELDELGLLGVKPSAESLKRYREKVVEIIQAQAAQGKALLVGRADRLSLADAATYCTCASPRRSRRAARRWRRAAGCLRRSRPRGSRRRTPLGRAITAAFQLCLG
jgi:hypothetical protein